jgi:hypothetical protein
LGIKVMSRIWFGFSSPSAQAPLIAPSESGNPHRAGSATGDLKIKSKSTSFLETIALAVNAQVK